MRAAQILEQRKPLRIGEVPDPTPGSKDVIVRVEACMGLPKRLARLDGRLGLDRTQPAAADHSGT